MLLTPGAFMVEHASLTPDGRTLVYSANAGTDRHDIDRRHLFKVRGGRLGVADGAHDGRRDRVEPRRHRRRTHRRVSRIRPRSARRCRRSCRSPAGSRDARAPIVCPRRVPTAQLVTPEAVIFKAPRRRSRCTGSCSRRPAATRAGRRWSTCTADRRGRCCSAGTTWTTTRTTTRANQYLASRGFIVLSVNYRLGIGYGHAFHFPRARRARAARRNITTCSPARSTCRSAPTSTPTRIGIWGGSYGGYLTALALGRNSDVFAAGVDIHGVHNWDRQGRPGARSAAAAWRETASPKRTSEQAARASCTSRRRFQRWTPGSRRCC